jgi:hypothetical protein
MNQREGGWPQGARGCAAKSSERFDKLNKAKQKADVAQLVEQPIRNRQVTSSSLVVGSIFNNLTTARC